MALIKTFVRNLLRPTHPGQLVLFVTDRCNCRCAMCFNAANVFVNRENADISLGDITKIAQSLYPLPQLLLSGGEPFMRNDVVDILRVFYEYAGTRQFSIPTNGTFPRRTVSVCEEMLSEHPDIALNLNLSMDNIGSEHDRHRGLEGCFDRVCETYALLDPLRKQYRGLSVNINTIITEETVEQADDIINTIRNRFAPNYHAVGILRSNYDTAVPEALLKLLVDKMCLDVMEKQSFNALPLLGRIAPALADIIKKKYIRSLCEQKRCFKCLAGKKIIVITADGRLMPCEPLWLEAAVRKNPDMNRYLMADLKEFGFNVQRALASDRAKAVKAFVAEKKCWCSYMCAIQNGILYSPEMYPSILLKMIWK